MRILGFLVWIILAGGIAPRVEPSVTITAEESVYTYEPANNGAGPMWCYGSTCLVRKGGQVFASGIETIPGAKPLNNVRWRLHRRDPAQWSVIATDTEGRTREPCPLSLTSDGKLYLFANPTLTPPDTYSGPARPEVLQFDARTSRPASMRMAPEWEGKPSFTEHSYRGMCADGPGRELLTFNVQGHDGYHWSFLNRDGRWSSKGFLRFPMGNEYEHPEPIRMCYPVMALRNRQAHAMLISDIIEPVKVWRDFKRQLTGREWDYDFRRLFYTWTPDVTRQGFTRPMEIASRERTAGHITNLDMWLDRRGRAHLLWLERSVLYPQMRDRFSPNTPLTTALEYAIVEHGEVKTRTTLAVGGEGASSEVPGYGRFHARPGNRLYVVAYFGGADRNGNPVSENRLIEIEPNGRAGRVARIPLQSPFTNFMTATERGGSPPSDTVDLLGEAAGRPGISYAQIKITGR